MGGKPLGLEAADTSTWGARAPPELLAPRAGGHCAGGAGGSWHS
ncbi:MAG TPA: hypothetical protein VMU50_14835 [Polyangia bacterium]|nr:hypothetical protein [Polyangia bacterium]